VGGKFWVTFPFNPQGQGIGLPFKNLGGEDPFFKFGGGEGNFPIFNFLGGKLSPFYSGLFRVLLGAEIKGLGVLKILAKKVLIPSLGQPLVN